MTPAGGADPEGRSGRAMAGLLVAVAALIVAYWVAWAFHRSLVASGTGVPYTQFEDAFPLADGFLVVCLLSGAY
ncbi:MAG TPA: hypothetical protein VEH82_03430, partial [Acidimicrobiales bacterium]|nr:hypothetical protein [Acidimicrobiales bacterium]